MLVEQIGDATLYLGDCLEILPTLTGIDAVVTDPPYGIGKDYGSLSCDTVSEMRRVVDAVIALGRPTVMTGSVSRIWEMPRAQWVGVWRKTYGTSGLIAYPFYPHWEPLFFYHVKGKYAGNNGHRDDVFEFAPARAQDSEHPTPKPVRLMDELIRFMRAQSVLDPFMGSGTTGVACANLGRKFIGIEIEPKYFDIACKRIDDAYKQPRLFDEPKPEPVQQDIFEVGKHG